MQAAVSSMLGRQSHIGSYCCVGPELGCSRQCPCAMPETFKTLKGWHPVYFITTRGRRSCSEGPSGGVCGSLRCRLQILTWHLLPTCLMRPRCQG